MSGRLYIGNRLVILLLSVLSLSVSLLASSPVNATSIYDDSLQLTSPTLRIESYQSPPQVMDLAANWSTKIVPGPYCSQSEVDSWNNREDWSVIQSDFNNTTGNARSIIISWVENGDISPRFHFETLGHGQSWESQRLVVDHVSGGYMTHGAIVAVDSGGNFTVSCDPGYGTNVISEKYTRGHNPYGVKLFLSTFDVIYPEGYEGVLVPGSNEWADLDGDGLVAAQETLQGTSNGSKDTDGDGLDDYVESQWNSNRDDIFCGAQCAYPNPVVKDLYVEIDWMKDSNNRTFKPSTAQLNLVKDAYEDKDIIFHADTGQFGGGNELATYSQTLRRTPTTGQSDYFDYKNGGDNIAANFSSDRNSIWRYMIYGYNYHEVPGSSGWAEVMGDDIFISGGLIEDMTGLVSVDRAVANTMMHEIGHNLCLSDEKIWEEQPLGCVYDGIDNNISNDPEYNLENYESVMNYRYQLTDIDDMGRVDYSDGTHGIGDHNDWSAVMTGMGSFTGTRTGLGAELAAKYTTMPDGSVVVDEAPIEEIRENNEAQSQQIRTPSVDINNSITKDPAEQEKNATDKKTSQNSSNDQLVKSDDRNTNMIEALSLIAIGVVLVVVVLTIRRVTTSK